MSLLDLFSNYANSNQGNRSSIAAVTPPTPAVPEGNRSNRGSRENTRVEVNITEKERSVDDRKRILKWLHDIGEDDQDLIHGVLDECRGDPAKLAYFLSRAKEAPIHVLQYGDGHFVSNTPHERRTVTPVINCNDLEQDSLDPHNGDQVGLMIKQRLN